LDVQGKNTLRIKSMKRLLGILVLTLLWSGNAYTESTEKRLDKIEERLEALEADTSLGELSNLFNNVKSSNEKKLKKELTDYQKEYIKNKIKLFELEAKIYNKSEYNPKGKPGVKFSIKNLGDRTLSEIEVMVYFLDKNGLAFAEKRFFPVSKLSYGGYKSLKPNYTYRLDENTFKAIDNLGDEWSGKIKIEISNIEFLD